MDGAQAVERPAVVGVSISDLRDVLVERSTPDIGVHAPDGMDQTMSADDDAGIRVQVIEDTKFLAAELPLLVSTEDELEPLGMHFGSVEEEYVRAERGVAGEAAIAGGFASAQDGANARDELFGVMRLADEIIRARLERLRDVMSFALRGQENDRRRVTEAANLVEHRESVEIRQTRVEQHEMHIRLPHEFQGGGAFMKNLGREAGVQELISERGGEATIVFNDDYQGLLLRAHAESRRGIRLGVLTYVKKPAGLPSLIKCLTMIDMSDVPEPSPRRKLTVRIFLVLFVASAIFMSWYGAKQQRLHGPKSDGKAKDPYEDRSLFGR